MTQFIPKNSLKQLYYKVNYILNSPKNANANVNANAIENTKHKTETIRLDGERDDTVEVSKFQEKWRKSTPVVVTNQDKRMNIDLCTPDALSAKFGGDEVSFINCETGIAKKNQNIKTYFDGFCS